MCPEVRPQGWLRWSACPFGSTECRGHASYPAFAPNTLFLLLAPEKWQLVFLVFLYLSSIICPNYACIQLFLVPYSFFVFCCLRRCLSRCKLCNTAAKGPRSQVPGPNLSHTLDAPQGSCSLSRLSCFPPSPHPIKDYSPRSPCQRGGMG